LRKWAQWGAWLIDSWPPAATMLGIAGCDLLHAERHGPQAGAAQLVDPPGRALHRYPGLDRGLAGRVLAGPGGEDLAENDLFDLARLDVGPAHRRLQRHRAEIGGRNADSVPLNDPTGVRAADTMTTAPCPSPSHTSSQTFVFTTDNAGAAAMLQRKIGLTLLRQMRQFHLARPRMPASLRERTSTQWPRTPRT
jgi:hypothetical protein